MAARRCLLIGHRGLHDACPENTVRAIDAALAAGADGVEVDLRRTSDGVVVLHHDEHLAGMKVSHTRYAELRTCHPELATLREAIDAISGRGFVDFELKEPGFEADVLAAIGASGLDKKAVMLSSFSDRIIRSIRSLDPEMSCGLIAGARASVEPLKWMWQQLALERAMACGARTIVIHHAMTTPRLLRRATRRGLPLMVWTVNDRDLARALSSEPSVSAIITDVPGTLADLVA